MKFLTIVFTLGALALGALASTTQPKYPLQAPRIPRVIEEIIPNDPDGDGFSNTNTDLPSWEEILRKRTPAKKAGECPLTCECGCGITGVCTCGKAREKAGEKSKKTTPEPRSSNDSLGDKDTLLAQGPEILYSTPPTTYYTPGRTYLTPGYYRRVYSPGTTYSRPALFGGTVTRTLPGGYRTVYEPGTTYSTPGSYTTVPGTTYSVPVRSSIPIEYSAPVYSPPVRFSPPALPPGSFYTGVEYTHPPVGLPIINTSGYNGFRSSPSYYQGGGSIPRSYSSSPEVCNT